MLVCLIIATRLLICSACPQFSKIRSSPRFCLTCCEPSHHEGRPLLNTQYAESQPFARDDVLAYELFNALPSIPRFDFIAAFLTDEEKRIANDILASNDAQGSIFAAWGLERAR